MERVPNRQLSSLPPTQQRERGMRRSTRLFFLTHDLLRKPGSTFRDHALFVVALALIVVVAFLGRQDLLGDQAGVLADRELDLRSDVRILLEEDLGVLAALADALTVVGEPRARL